MKKAKLIKMFSDCREKKSTPAVHHKLLDYLVNWFDTYITEEGNVTKFLGVYINQAISEISEDHSLDNDAIKEMKLMLRKRGYDSDLELISIEGGQARKNQLEDIESMLKEVFITQTLETQNDNLNQIVGDMNKGLKFLYEVIDENLKMRAILRECHEYFYAQDITIRQVIRKFLKKVWRPYYEKEIIKNFDYTGVNTDKKFMHAKIDFGGTSLQLLKEGADKIIFRIENGIFFQFELNTAKPDMVDIDKIRTSLSLEKTILRLDELIQNGETEKKEVIYTKR